MRVIGGQLCISNFLLRLATNMHDVIPVLVTTADVKHTAGISNNQCHVRNGPCCKTYIRDCT